MAHSFYGWYFKCQTETQTLAVIPALHQRTCSIQIITQDKVCTAVFPRDVWRQKDGRISIGESCFGRDGIELSVHTSEVNAQGRLRFGELTTLRYDIMGPFAFVPFLECRHSVHSMQHTVSGTVQLNGSSCSFQEACGYWEGDRGRSFPKTYAWTQCCFDAGSLMLSVADIPLAGLRFTGTIGFVLWKDRAYRIATYLGARVMQKQDGILRVVQGGLELEARLLQASGQPLQAPTKGAMVRTIHESAACRAFYRFAKGKQTLFAFETDRASFEYEYPH